MIWATVSSQSWFCWLYRASPSLAAKNITNLISVLSIWLCPCVESSLVLFEEGVCYDQCFLLAKLYQPLPCFIPYPKAKFACYSRCLLTSYFSIPVPYNEKDIIFGCLNSLWPYRLYCPWNSPGHNTGVDSLSLLQVIFPTQGSNPSLTHCLQILYQLSHKGSPKILEWVAVSFSNRSSWPRNQTGVSCIAGGFFTYWVIREDLHAKTR